MFLEVYIRTSLALFTSFNTAFPNTWLSNADVSMLRLFLHITLAKYAESAVLVYKTAII